jgi:hypothetical protein
MSRGKRDEGNDIDLRVVGEKPPLSLRTAPGRVEIVQSATDVGPTGPNNTWLMAIGGETYRALYLRPWAVAFYNRRCATGLAEAQWCARRFTERRELAEGRIRAAHRSALRFLLRQAFPWRFSYRLRGDPVRLALRASDSEKGFALIALLAHVRDARRPTLRDRVASRLFPTRPHSNRST